MSVGKVVVIAFGSAVVGGLVVAAFMGERVQKIAQNLNPGSLPNPKGPSPMISGFNRPLEMDSQS